MSDQAKLKEKIKKTIKALVVSAPLGLTPKEIEQDYVSFEGHPLPYRQLGYNTCRDLLQDIPDTVQSQWERGQLVVRATVDASTQRLQSLVARQRVDVVKCLKKRHAIERSRTGPRLSVSVAVAKSLNLPVSSRSTSRGPGPGPGPGSWRSGAGGHGGLSPNSRPKPRGPPAVQPTVPAFVRNQIKFFLISHPNGVPNNHFDMLFAEKFGHTICCNKLGFESLRHMCQALADFVSVENLSRGDFRIYEKSNYPGGEPFQAENNSISQNSAKTTRVNLQSQSNNLNSDNKKPSPPHNSFTPERNPRNFQNDSNRTTQKAATQPNSLPIQNAGVGNVYREPNEKAQKPDTRQRTPSVSTQSKESAQQAGTSSTPSELTSELFDTKFLLEIQQILEQHPDGLWAAYLSETYKKEFKKPLPMMSLGYFSVTELMADMPEIVAIEREQKQGDWKLFDVRTYKPKTQESSKPKTPENSKKTDSSDPTEGFQKLKDKIRRLLENFPEGILLKNLPLYYQREFCDSLPSEELGFRDLESLIMMMPEVATVVYKGYGRLLIVLVEESSMRPRDSVPADAVGWGFGYIYPDFPPVHEYIEVYVATVFTPHRLCIQLKEKQRNEDLDNLMDNLESIYAYPEGNKYEFPESMIAVGQVCCALYLSDNNWHRGLITGIPKVDFVEVLYVDYGTVATVSRASLRLLKSCFLRLPIQAYNGRLAFIEPAEDKWTRESRDWLLTMTAGKPLIAIITEIQKDELYLLISDTTTEEDIHINDALVEAGLAIFPKVLQDENAQHSEELCDSKMALLTLNDLVSKEMDGSLQTQHATVCEVTNHDSAENEQATENTSHEDESAAYRVIEDPELPSLESESNPSSDDQNCKSTDIPKLEVASSDEELPWIIKRIDLDDGYQVHLINFDNEACLTIAEVVDIVCEGEDSEPEEFFCQQVSALGFDVNLLSATEEEHPRLFQEFRRFELLDSSENSPKLLTMMPFTSALLLLSSCGTVSMDLVIQLQDEVESMGMLGDLFGSDISDTAINEIDLTLELEELNMTLDVLKFKRKQILDSMIQKTDVNSVDKLTHIEQKIAEMSSRLEDIKAILQPQDVPDNAASGVSAGGNTLTKSEQQKNRTSSTNTAEARNREPDEPRVPDYASGNVDSDRNSKSPWRLVQAVEPRPRDEMQSSGAAAPKPKPVIVLQAQQQQSQSQAGQAPNLTQAGLGQSQGRGPPPTNQNPQFMPHTSHHATFPNLTFVSQPSAPYTPQNPLSTHYPGYQQHLGSGNFAPMHVPMNPPTWLGPPPPQNAFVDPLNPPQQIPITHLQPLPMGYTTGAIIVNPPSFYPNASASRGHGQNQPGQNSWW